MAWSNLVSSNTWGAVSSLDYSFINTAPASYYIGGNLIPSIADDFNSTPNFSNIDPTQVSLINDILTSLSSGYRAYLTDVVNLTFSADGTGNGDVLIGSAHLDSADYAGAYFPGIDPNSGDVWFTNDATLTFATLQVDVGQIGRLIAMHELVHAVAGLEDAITVYSGTYEDSQNYTIMSYNPAGWLDNGQTATNNSLYFNYGTNAPLYAYGLQYYDIAAIQSVFGNQNTSIRNETTDGNPSTTGTLYGFGSGLGRGASIDNAFLYTIWDGGGTTDTLDASAFRGYSAKISLIEGTFSSIGGTGNPSDKQGYDLSHFVGGLARDINNVAIAYDTIIENARGGDQADRIIGNNENNTIMGGRGADSLSGGSGADTYIWNQGDGSDTITDDWVSDVIVLGTGITQSMVSLTAIGADLKLTINPGVYTSLLGPGYGGEIIIKNQASNIGTFLASHVTGIIPESQHYTPIPSNTYTGTSGVNIYLGTSGNDSISGAGGADTLNGGGGDDIMSGYGPGFTLNGGAGRDKLHGDGVYGVFNGGDDDDWLNAGMIMNGDAGNDIIEGSQYTATINGGIGNDVISSHVNSTGINIDAGSGNDFIYSSSGSAVIAAGAGDDILRIYGDNSTITLGSGVDVINFGYSGLSNRHAMVITGQQIDILYKSSTWSNVTLAADTGLSVTDYSRMTNTDDLLIAFSGGGFTQVVDYYLHMSEWTLPVVIGTTTITGTGSSDVLMGFYAQNIIDGGAGDDTLYGNSGADVLNGGDGEDTLFSLAGNDTITGGIGDDIVWLWDTAMGLDSGDVSFSRDGNDLIVSVTGGRTLTFTDQYVQVSGVYTHAVETLGDAGGNVDIMALMSSVNIVPQAQSDTFTTNEDTAKTGNVFTDNGSGTDSDADSDTFTVTSHTNAAHGVVSIEADGDFTYTPDANYNGADSFTYTISDGNGGFDTATVHLTVTGVGDAPSLTNNGTSINRDSVLSFVLTTSMLSATDAYTADNALVFTVGTLPAYGTLRLNDAPMSVNGTFTKQDIVDGKVSYITPGDYIGADSFQFTVSDGTTTLSAATFAISVTSALNVVTGTAGADTLTGSSGNDLYLAKSGADDVNTNGGNDVIYLGDGNDRLNPGNYSNAGSMTIYAGNGSDSINASLNNDLIYGGDDTEVDSISGFSGNDTIYGGGGADGLYGDDGSDTLYGGMGNDYLSGGSGDDLFYFYVGDGGDTIVDASGTDKIVLGVGFTMEELVISNSGSYNTFISFANHAGDSILISNHRSGGTMEKLAFAGGGEWNFPLYGTSSGETITGTSGADVFYGYGGDDTFITGNGADIIYGGDGADKINAIGTTSSKTIYGGAGGESIDAGNDVDIIYGGDGGESVSGNDGNDTIYGNIGADYLHGDAGNDILYGGEDDDYLRGWDGNDTLYGGAGNNTLIGNAGADTFIFEAASAYDTADIITDFSKTDSDKIGLTDLLGAYDPNQHVINNFVSISSSGGNTILAVDRDGTGSTYAAAHIATINGQTWSSLNDMIASGHLNVPD